MKQYKTETPCKGCDKRTPDCHGKCESYLTWSKNGVEIGSSWTQDGWRRQLNSARAKRRESK